MNHYLPLNDQAYLDPERFEYFCLDLANQYFDVKFFKRGRKGQRQGGYDLVSLDKRIHVECKQYATDLDLTKLKGFIDKYFENSLLETTAELIFMTSAKFDSTNQVDFLTSQNTISKEKGLELLIDVWDVHRISRIVFDKKLIGIVSRYFSKEIFRQFFGEKTYNQYYGNENYFRHYGYVLKPEKKTPFLFDITENIIRENQVYFDQTRIEEIEAKLENERICLISGAEGRGKTVLSRIIAYKKYHIEDFDVFFVDLKFLHDLAMVEDRLYDFSNLAQRYLIVFENVHVWQEIEAFMRLLDNFVASCNNLYFVLNSRPTDSDGFKEWSQNFLIGIAPKKEDIQGIVSLYARQSGKPVEPSSNLIKFIGSKIFTSNSVNGANLRMLNIYLEVWRNSSEELSLLDIDESIVLSNFHEIYRLSHCKVRELEFLLKVSSIYQFDAPFFVDPEQDPEEYDLLKSYCLQGLLLLENRCFYFPHCVDASYLLKAICKNLGLDHEQQAATITLNYVERLINATDPRSESIFKQIIRTVMREKMSITAWRAFMDCITDVVKDEFPTRIIDSLNLGFLISVLIHPFIGGSQTQEKVFLYYKELIVNFGDRLRTSGPFGLALMNAVLKKRYGYHGFCGDIFHTVEQVEQFWSQIYASQGVIRKLREDIATISPEFEIVVKEWGVMKSNAPSAPHPRINIVSTIKRFGAVAIDAKLLSGFLNPRGQMPKEKQRQVLKEISEDGFYFKDATWNHIAKFFQIICERKNELNPRSKSLMMAIELMDYLLGLEGIFSLASAKELSMTLHHLERISVGYYQSIIGGSVFKSEIARRFLNPSYSEAEFYLLGHTYNQNMDWGKELIIDLIHKADHNQQKCLRDFVAVINKKFPVIAPNTVCYLINEQLG